MFSGLLLTTVATNTGHKITKKVAEENYKISCVFRQVDPYVAMNIGHRNTEKGVRS
jgi:hypothetical protein